MTKKIWILILGLLLLTASNVFADDVSIDSSGNVKTGVANANAELEVTGASGEGGIVGSASGTGASGVYGINSTYGNYGILGFDSYGVFGYSSSGYAGYFQGNARVTGNLTVDGTFNVSETDPQVGVLVNGNWCTSDGTQVNCNQGTPLLIETDPTVPASVKDGIDWTEVTSRPAGLDDGDDVGITIETDPEVGANLTNYIPKWDGGALVSGSIYENSGKVGIGTTSPAGALEVARDQDNTIIWLTGYNIDTGNPPLFVGRKARGTMALPGAVQLGDMLAGFAGYGYGLTNWSSSSRGRLSINAAENWTNTAQGTYVAINTTGIGTVSSSEKMRITDAGNVGIGTTAPAQKLTVSGTIESTSGGVKFPDGTTQTTAAIGSGTITAVNAGTGLSGGGTSGDVTLNADSAYLQRRVTGDCIGQVISGINADGAVSCEADDGITTETDPEVGALTNGMWCTSNGSSVNCSTAAPVTIETDPQVGTIPTNYVPKWDGSALVTGAIYDNGNVGIGTAAPNEQLEITGNLRLPATTATTGIIKSGANTLMHTYGSGNFFAGLNAGNLTMTGFANTASGAAALYSNITGTDNTAGAYRALYSNTTGSYNTASGADALFWNTTGNYNTAGGYFALRANTSASKNTAIGSYALLSQSYNNSGTAWDSHNTAVGNEALFSNQPTNIGNGTYNTAVGSLAMRFNTTGSINTATGYSALYSNTIGAYNTATGVSALYSNTTGSFNTAGGQGALYANTTASNNTAGGHAALFSNTTANKNTALGVYALRAQSYNNGGTAWDSLNTAVGFEALYANQPTATTNGVYNTAVGSLALRSNTTGSNNTAGGEAALFSNTTASKNTALGTSALNTQSYNNLGTVWDSHNTAVGFEALYSNQPTATTNGGNNTAVGSLALRANSTGGGNTACGGRALQSNTTGDTNTAIGSQTLSTNTTGDMNTAIGYQALINNTTGIRNTATGYNTLYSNTTGTYNTAIGYGAGASSSNLTNATAIGSNASVNASNKGRIGDSSVTVIEGQVAWSWPSDIRIKKEIEDIGYGLEFVKQLRPVQYKLNEGNDRTDFGFIAQDIEALLGTGYNILSIGEDAERSLSMRYTDLIAPMVKAMQEQQEMIDSQQAQIDELKAMIAELRKRL